MSKGPENTFIASVHRHLPPFAPGFYYLKNHNAFNGGIADSWYSARGDLWVEYKFIKVPKRGTTVIDLITPTPKTDSEISSLQKEWLTSRHHEGRNVGVIVGCKDGGVWFPGIKWDRTYTADEFVSMLSTRKELAEIIKSVVGAPHR